MFAFDTVQTDDDDMRTTTTTTMNNVDKLYIFSLDMDFV